MLERPGAEVPNDVGGNGLGNMRARTEELGGVLNYNSCQNGGTVIDSFILSFLHSIIKNTAGQ